MLKIFFILFIKKTGTKEKAIKEQDSGRQKMEIGIVFSFFSKETVY